MKLPCSLGYLSQSVVVHANSEALNHPKPMFNYPVRPCSNRIALQAKWKGPEVPNPRRSSACDCTCVLTRNQSLSCDLPHALFCSCPCKVRSRVSDAVSQALCNLPFICSKNKLVVLTTVWLPWLQTSWWDSVYICIVYFANCIRQPERKLPRPSTTSIL